MPDPMVLIADNDLLLPIILLGGLALLATVLGQRRGTRRSAAPRPDRREASVSRPEADRNEGIAAPAYDKLRVCTVRAKPIMSREQAALYRNLRPWAESRGVLLQCEISMSAIFDVRHPEDQKLARAAFATIRQKYLDILVTDDGHNPLCGIEYHGSGHWDGNARQRDLAKAMAFATAGLPFVVIERGYDLSEVLARLDDVMGLADDSTTGRACRTEPALRGRSGPNKKGAPSPVRP